MLSGWLPDVFYVISCCVVRERVDPPSLGITGGLPVRVIRTAHQVVVEFTKPQERYRPPG